MSVETVTDANFAERIGRYQGVALVDFWASWCMPCRLVSPIIEKLAEQFDGKVRVAKLNVDEQPKVAGRYQIMSIPTIGIFRDGKLVNTLVGVRTERIYQQALEAALNPAAASPTKAGQAAGAKQHSVTVFSTPTCPWCARLKAYLRQHNIAFKDVDVSRDAKAAQDMVRRSGQMGVPQAWIDGQVIVGFDRKRVDSLLNLKAAS